MMTPDAESVILITGGTGFTGSHLLEALLSKQAGEVHVSSFSGADAFVSSRLPASQLHKLDLTDRAATTKLLKNIRPTHIYHLASIAAVGSSFQDAERVLQNNTQLQVSLLESVATTVPAARVVAVSSAEVYGLSEPGELPITEDHPLRPVNPYAVSKITQDMLAYTYALSRELQLVRVRPFNHIGERQSPDFAVAAFAQQIARIEQGVQDVLRVGNLDAVRDFTDVQDMVNAYMLLMERGTVGDVYNVGSGVGVAIREVLELLISLSTVPVQVEIDEARVRPLDIPEAVASPTKIHELGWQPKITLEETLTRILNYWRETS